MESGVTRENIGKHLLERQLSIINKDLMVLIDDDNWRFNYTLTYNEYFNFRMESKKVIQKVFKCNSRKTESIFDQFYEMFGLRIKN
jgi:hypothetical protein